jgi:hypothetical protein
MLEAPAGEWQRRYVELGIPGATVRNIKEAFEHPHVAERNMLVSFDHPVGTRLKVAGSPVKMSAHPFTGSPPFSGGSVVEVCGHHLHTAPEPPSARAPRPVPPDLEAILLRCLAKSRTDRPGSARELRDQLLACRAAHDFTQERAARWWAERGRHLVRAARKAAARPSDAPPSMLVTRVMPNADSAPH